ncbi:MAG TPA: TonB-dependent receptor, partial [Ferruginibacter sp.]|nr:TonB-dependent receptor [Ferruginibacter sp.]
LLLLICTATSFAQYSSIIGFAVQSNGKPVQGVSVHLLNTNIFAISDQHGQFLLSNVFPGNYIIAASAVNFSGVSKEVVVGESQLRVTLDMNESYKQLSEVIVSSQKKEERLRDVLGSITLLDSRSVEEYRLWNAKDLTAISPALYSANPGDNRNVTSVRGIVSASYEQAVATYIDGVNQFGLDTYIADLFDIERIEVLRGPQGPLYGRNAMGGVINIITKKPGNETGLSAQLTQGNYGLQRYNLSLRTPIINNKLFFGISALYERSNGYFTNEYNNSAYDKKSMAGANYYLRYMPGKKWEVTANVKHVHNRNNGAFPLVFGVDQAFEKPFRLNQNAVTKMIDNIFNASLSLKFTGRKLLFTSQTAYQFNRRYYTDPIDADFSPLDAISIINNYGNDWNKSSAITQEFSLRSNTAISKALSWSVGSYLFHQDNPVYQTSHFGKDAQLLGSPDKNFSLKSITKSKATGAAVYGEVDYRLNASLKLTVGLRYDHEKKKMDVEGIYEKDQGPTFPFRTDTSADASFSNVSPRAGLTWQIANNHTAFLTYSRGYRSGGLTPLSSDPSQPALYPFDAEHSSGIEAGIRSSFAERRVSLDVSVFHTTVSNAQVPTLILPDAVTITRNTGKLTSTGVEAELHASLWKKLQLSYSFAYCDAHYNNLKVSQNGSEVDLKGKKQVFTPDITNMLAVQFSQSLNKAGTTL